PGDSRKAPGLTVSAGLSEVIEATVRGADPRFITIRSREAVSRNRPKSRVPEWSNRRTVTRWRLKLPQPAPTAMELRTVTGATWSRNSRGRSRVTLAGA